MTLQATSQQTQSNFLQRVLQANGLFSGVSGLLFVFASGPLAAFLGLEAPFALVAIGLILFLYAAMLFINAGRSPVDRRFVWTAIISDVAWGAGSAVILFTGWVPLTTAGWWAVAIVADVVAVFAILQFYGLRREAE